MLAFKNIIFNLHLCLFKILSQYLFTLLYEDLFPRLYIILYIIYRQMDGQNIIYK